MKNPQYFDPARLGPDAGLTNIDGLYHLRFIEDGKTRRVSLKTRNKATAIKRRSDHITYLKTLGATPTDSLPDAKLNKIKEDPRDPNVYIYRRPEVFRVKIKGVQIGEYDTVEEAIEARNFKLGITNA